MPATIDEYRAQRRRLIRQRMQATKRYDHVTVARLTADLASINAEIARLANTTSEEGAK